MKKHLTDALDLSHIATKTAFVHLAFRSFGNLKRSTVDVNTTAVKTRFKRQKQLLDSPELAAITKADVALRNLLEEYCLPSSIDSGLRTVPNENAKVVEKILTNYEEVERPALVEEFLAVYETQVKTAKKELKEHFDPAHYPTVEDMREEFSFEYHFLTFGQPPEHLKAFAPKLFERETKKAHKVVMDAAQDVADAMRQTAAELVSKLADGLSGDKTVDGKQKRFNDAHVDNLKQFVESFDIRNVTSDGALKSEMDKLKGLMAGVSAEKIKNNEGLKTDMAAKVAAIAKSVGILAEVKGRKFRD